MVIKLLKDGSGRVRIHWFVRDVAGPITTPGSVTMTALGPLTLGNARGRIACAPGQKELSQVVGQEVHPCCCSDDVRAVTCPECRAAAGFQEAQDRLAEILETSVPVSSGG